MKAQEGLERFIRNISVTISIFIRLKGLLYGITYANSQRVKRFKILKDPNSENASIRG